MPKIFATATRPGIAYIQVKSGQLTKTIEVKFQAPVQEENFIFNVSKNMVAADNYSYAEISVETKDLNILKTINTCTGIIRLTRTYASRNL